MHAAALGNGVPSPKEATPSTSVKKQYAVASPSSHLQDSDDQCNACTMTRSMAQHSLLLAIEYHIDDVPAGGSAVFGSLAAPVKHKNKDAAGHIFHEIALRQSGFYGETSMYQPYIFVLGMSPFEDKQLSRRTWSRQRCSW